MAPNGNLLPKTPPGKLEKSMPMQKGTTQSKIYKKIKKHKQPQITNPQTATSVYDSKSLENHGIIFEQTRRQWQKMRAEKGIRIGQIFKQSK